MESLTLGSGFQVILLVDAKARRSVRWKSFKAPKAVAGDLKQHLNPSQSSGRSNLAGIGAAAILYAYSRLKPSPCEMLLKGGPASHFFSLAKGESEGIYLPRDEDARRLYAKIQEANRPYVIVHGPSSSGKTELMKEMCRTVKSGILYFDHSYYLKSTLPAIYWELGCYLRSISFRLLHFIQEFFIPSFLYQLFEQYLDKQCQHAFSPRGVLFRASQEYRNRTGKRVICIMDNVPDGCWWRRLVNPLKDVLVNDSSFCLVFVSFDKPGNEDGIRYDPPSREELKAFLSQNYKLPPEIIEEIVTTNECFDIRDLTRLARCYETKGEDSYRSLRSFILAIQPRFFPFHIVRKEKAFDI